jgi:hypothetical protein
MMKIRFAVPYLMGVTSLPAHAVDGARLGFAETFGMGVMLFGAALPFLLAGAAVWLLLKFLLSFLPSNSEQEFANTSPIDETVKGLCPACQKLILATSRECPFCEAALPENSVK